MNQNPKYDGIRISSEFLKQNEKKLLSIAENPTSITQSKTRVIHWWIPISIAASILLLLSLFIPNNDKKKTDPFDQLAGLDLMELYENGMLDLEPELLYSTFSEEDQQAITDEFQYDFKIDEVNLDELLDVYNEEELFTLING